MRPDLTIIENWIPSDAKVLDLGCGDGELLAHLKTRGATGLGMEIDPKKINQCIARGVNVVQRDLNDGLTNIGDNHFDVVLMTHALQVVNRPDEMLREMLRVGDQAIVTFPNFGHWSTRAYLGILGRMPMSRALPNSWFDTPNIHLCTFKDFEILVNDLGFRILRRSVVDRAHNSGRLMNLMPNLLGEIAIYQLCRK